MTDPARRPTAPSDPAAGRTDNNAQAIAAIVVGALAIVLMFVLPGLGLFAALVLGIVAIVLGVKAKRASTANQGKAVTGIVLGGIATALSLLFLILAAIGIAVLSGSEEGQDLLDEADEQSAPAVTATV